MVTHFSFWHLTYCSNLVSILITWLISLLCHQCQRRRLLKYDWKDHYWRREIVDKECFQSLFFHWCLTYYLLEWQLLIRSKYYHLVDWWRGFNQQDVTREPKGKVELWYCSEVQGLDKTMVKWCIGNIFEDIEVGHT